MRRAFSRLPPHPEVFVWPELYGARGDGVTDDMPALRAAATSGFPVLLSEKTYLLKAGDVIDFDVTLVGAHRQKSILRWGDATGSTSLFRFSGAAVNVCFSNLTMDGNRQGHTDNSSYFGMVDFQPDDGSRLELDRVDFINGRIIDVVARGPTADGEMIDVDIHHCHFSDGLVGSSSRAAQIASMSDNVDASISFNRASLPTQPATYGRAGFIMQRAGVSPVITSYGRYTAIGNRFKHIGFGTANTLGCLDVYSGAQQIVMSGNAGEDGCGRFITVKGDQDTISITGNVAKNWYSSDINTATPFVMFGDLFDAEKDRDVIFANNVVRGSLGYGFFFDGRNAANDVDFRNLLISANIADDCGIAGYHFRNLENVLVSAPMIDACPTGISVAGCSGVFKVDGGLITNSTNGFSIGDFTQGPLTDLDFVLKGTTIQNTTGRAVYMADPVKSYDIDVDIDTADRGIYSSGSTGLSRIRARMRSVTEPWARNGTDLKMRPPQIDSDVDLSYSGLKLVTIASGVITALLNYHWVDTEAAAASDDLDTITAGHEGQMLTLFCAATIRDVVVKDATGNLRLAGDMTLDRTTDSITLMYRTVDSVWVELSRSNNDV